jgi:hypothetical protein
MQHGELAAAQYLLSYLGVKSFITTDSAACISPVIRVFCTGSQKYRQELPSSLKFQFYKIDSFDEKD